MGVIPPGSQFMLASGFGTITLAIAVLLSSVFDATGASQSRERRRIDRRAPGTAGGVGRVGGAGGRVTPPVAEDALAAGAGAETVGNASRITDMMYALASPEFLLPLIPCSVPP